MVGCFDQSVDCKNYCFHLYFTEMSYCYIFQLFCFVPSMFGVDKWLRWEISGSLVLSSPHNERTSAAATGRRAKESGLFFNFLSDKTQNHVLFDIIVDFVTHKLKNQPLFSKLRKAKFFHERTERTQLFSVLRKVVNFSIFE